MQKKISITGISSISALGASASEIWRNYLNPNHFLQKPLLNPANDWVAVLPTALKSEIAKLKNSDSKYKRLDDSVLFALFTARETIKRAGIDKNGHFGINVGSSRGATSKFEYYFQEFLNSDQASTLSSPTTTLGNISSWISHDLQSNGPEISHSITCSTALHALLNGVAWISSGMTDQFLVGGSEAPLTPFTISQMKALKIYADNSDSNFPCRALDMEKSANSMVLGEGASMAFLEAGEQKNALAKIIGIGYATEVLEHNISISSSADCLQKSMRMAIGNIPKDKIDAIVLHAPGTIKGDQSEVNAINAVFGDETPALTSNKWKLGHSLGPSGMLSIELAVLMLKHQQFIPTPFTNTAPSQLRNILVNAVGFGGNAVSVLLERP